MWAELDETLVDDVTFEPPLLAVYHPEKLYPVLVGVARDPYVLPYVTVFELVDTLPPFALYVTFTETGMELRDAVPLTETVPHEIPLAKLALIETLFDPSESCFTVFEPDPMLTFVPTAQLAGKSNLCDVLWTSEPAILIVTVTP